MSALTIFPRWKNRILMLAWNATMLLVFLAAAYFLQWQAGLVGTPAPGWSKSHVAAIAVAAIFLMAVLASWPLSFLCLCISGAFAGSVSPPRFSPAIVLAWLEAGAWGLIWIGFTVVFFPAIICGLR